MRTGNKNKKISALLNIILVIAICTAGYSGYKLYQGLRNYQEIDDTYEEIRTESRPAASAETEVKEENGRDWETLLNINPDTAGWISLADSSVDYPVVYGSDNSWYLNHLFDGTWNPGGSIFVDCRNSRGFTDRNTVIYGHHMNNDAMFHDIEKYKDAAYYETHRVLSLETPDGNYELRPVGGIIKKGTDDYVQIQFSSEEEFQQYVQTFRNESTFESDVQIDTGDKTVLLSTCTDEIQNGRYALLCKLISVGG